MSKRSVDDQENLRSWQATLDQLPLDMDDSGRQIRMNE